LEETGAVNLNIFNEYHRKSRKNSGATLGVDMEIDEIAVFYVEENLTTPYRWKVVEPTATPIANGATDGGMFGDGLEYISHVFEVISTEYRAKPAPTGFTGSGGIRMFAVRGRKPNEIELPERV